jgi:hypothetical protein
MTLLGTICSAIIAGIFSLFGKKAASSENTQAVEVANKAGALSADESRATRANTDKELAANDAQTDADLARVRSANSLPDGQAAVADAIARSRSHASADS